ncbi:MAG: Flp family type IVb pilin [Candidatus Eremiobacteraeota bacterium]|nr:Flp family type IVb pilin [Candidatus Eremiobacteraeota bacterium]MBV8331339.1 Flp family type IVb pilin [Candidatus Eremiobacteraeota bacterium]MBV8433537.1 Flp family type IVb pilin [Candidatus Eremiobacteraeota bacterium]MBV8655877.1 Flp family type IVb pilin [Candidatus Eremiobacteraeota bacterium]MBV8722607.1 Flp family type IVb pilin [Candidatus Eremiobacteraeota bacterium]
MRECLQALLWDEQGASLVEYALVVTLIAIVAIIAISAFGNNTSTVLGTAAASV